VVGKLVVGEDGSWNNVRSHLKSSITGYASIIRRRMRESLYPLKPFPAEYLLEFLRAAGAASSIRMQVKDADSAAEFQPSGEDGEKYRYIQI
jgi:hypothetical protein